MGQGMSMVTEAFLLLHKIPQTQQTRCAFLHNHFLRNYQGLAWFPKVNDTATSRMRNTQILIIILLGDEPWKEPCALKYGATNPVWGGKKGFEAVSDF